MAETIIDTTYFKVTQNVVDPHTDFYRIYPFDSSGNLYKRIQIDVDIANWNGLFIPIYIPEISTLNLNFDLEITITNYTISELRPTPPLVVAGNNVDQWYFTGQLNTIGSMVWTPESFKPASNSGNAYGSWCVVPNYPQGDLPGVASAMLELPEAPPEFTIDWSLYAPKKKKPTYLIR